MDLRKTSQWQNLPRCSDNQFIILIIYGIDLSFSATGARTLSAKNNNVSYLAGNTRPPKQRLIAPFRDISSREVYMSNFFWIITLKR